MRYFFSPFEDIEVIGIVIVPLVGGVSQINHWVGCLDRSSQTSWGSGESQKNKAAYSSRETHTNYPPTAVGIGELERVKETGYFYFEKVIGEHGHSPLCTVPAGLA